MPLQTRVVLRDLKKQQHLNGLPGEVVNFVHALPGVEGKGRYEVSVGAAGMFLLKPENLEVRAHGIICGIQARPELNGRKGNVIEWQAETGRFKVEIEGETDEYFALRPANIRMAGRGTTAAPPQAD